jgi:hypothetical protein
VWDEQAEYRIKPKETVKYRVALFKFASGYETQSVQNHNNVCEQCHTFVRWLTDWVEVEV